MGAFCNTIGFEHIIEQGKPISHLKSLIKKNSSGSAYLFIGQEGVGKKTSAICFAKALACHDSSACPCNGCSSCKKIQHMLFFHPDIVIYRDIYSPLAVPRYILLKKMGFDDGELDEAEEIYLEYCGVLEEKGFLLNPVNPRKGVNSIDFFYLDPDKIFVEKDNRNFVSSTRIQENLESLNKENKLYLLAKSLYTFTSGFYKGSFKIGAQEGNDGRENIRAVIREIYLKPSEGKRKIFILDDAHKMTEEAADAFLKTLEEPPEDSIIILITQKPEMLLPTIHSRCQKIKFNSLGKNSIYEFVKNKRYISDREAMLIASLSQGSMSKALEMNLKEVFRKRDNVINLFAGNNLREIETFFYFAREFSGEAEKDRKLKAKAAGQYIELMFTWLHDMILVKRNGKGEYLVNFDKLSELGENSGKLTYKQLEDVFSIVSKTSSLLSRNLDARMTMEALFVEMSRILNPG